MSGDIIRIPPAKLARLGLDALPRLIVDAGDRAARKFIEFFTATIRNKNTRLACARAVAEFFNWCEVMSVGR